MNRLLLLIFLCLLPLAVRGAAPEIVLWAPAMVPVEQPTTAGPGTRTMELPLPNVVYSVHLYEPAPFTIQGVTLDMPTGVTYPGIIDGVRWDRTFLARSLQVVANHQRFYHVAVYIGEFSTIRWAPGAEIWLRDAIRIFEADGWDWSYHAFREWQGWSVEYGPDKDATAPNAAPTDREKLLRSWYAKNARPKP